MSYPYSSFYLEAQWSRIKVAEHFDFGTGCPCLQLDGGSVRARRWTVKFRC
jgi:hypothetical protein